MNELPEAVRKLVDQAIVRSPYGRLIGAELAAARADEIAVRLPYREELTTMGDLVHGGVIAGLIDIAATACFWAHPEVGENARGTTVGFSVSFLSGARGSDLLATARVRRRGRSISTGDVTVTDADGTEVAAAMVTYKLS